MEEIIVSTATLDQRALAAAQSSEEAEALIIEFQPFLRGCVQRYAAKDEWQKREELYSIALGAFYEAIKAFNEGRGHFFPFATQVIRRRILDYLRQLYQNNTLSLTMEGDFHAEDSAVQDWAVSSSHKNFMDGTRQQMLAIEIEQFTRELSTWNITLEMLVAQSPKHSALKKTYRDLVELALADAELVQTVQLKHYLPIKKIEQTTKIHRKTLERARTFIVASIIILTGDYDYLSEFVGKGR